MPSDTPVSTMIEGFFFLGLFIFAIYMLSWYFKECQQIDREFEQMDRDLAELRAKNQTWFDNHKRKS